MFWISAQCPSFLYILTCLLFHRLQGFLPPRILHLCCFLFLFSVPLTNWQLCQQNSSGKNWFEEIHMGLIWEGKNGIKESCEDLCQVFGGSCFEVHGSWPWPLLPPKQAQPLLPLCREATASLRWNPEELGRGADMGLWVPPQHWGGTCAGLLFVFLSFLVLFVWFGGVFWGSFHFLFVWFWFVFFKFNLGVLLLLLLMKTLRYSMFCMGNKNLLVCLLLSFLNYLRDKLLIIEVPVFFHHIAPLKGLCNINRCFT